MRAREVLHDVRDVRHDVRDVHHKMYMHCIYTCACTTHEHVQCTCACIYAYYAHSSVYITHDTLHSNVILIMYSDKVLVHYISFTARDVRHSW